ncbi:hypothetical protein VTN00DRAFT_9595 [Thermoascus crustaceus]|uniref:uncharacterized protein n=1 Tax=Thermoascus crustaceus TaxID=5088 RepID=UPI003742EEAB
MAPLVPIFPTTSLPERVQILQTTTYREKRRKGGPIDLEKCALLEMLQYSCNPPAEGVPEPGVVRCKPVVRLFRRCAQGLTVETTAWEKQREAQRDQIQTQTGKKNR